VLDAADLKVDT